MTCLLSWLKEIEEDIKSDNIKKEFEEWLLVNSFKCEDKKKTANKQSALKSNIN